MACFSPSWCTPSEPLPAGVVGRAPLARLAGRGRYDTAGCPRGRRAARPAGRARRERGSATISTRSSLRSPSRRSRNRARPGADRRACQLRAIDDHESLAPAGSCRGKSRATSGRPALQVGHRRRSSRRPSPRRRRSLRDRVVRDGLSVRRRRRPRATSARRRARDESRGAVQVVDPDLAEPRGSLARPHADPGPAARQCQSRPHRDQYVRGRRADTPGQPDPGRAVSDADSQRSETPAWGRATWSSGRRGASTACWRSGASRKPSKDACTGRSQPRGRSRWPEAVVHARIEVDALIVEGLVEGKVVSHANRSRSARERVRGIRGHTQFVAEGGGLEGRLRDQRAPARPQRQPTRHRRAPPRIGPPGNAHDSAGFLDRHASPRLKETQI